MSWRTIWIQLVPFCVCWKVFTQINNLEHLHLKQLSRGDLANSSWDVSFEFTIFFGLWTIELKRNTHTHQTWTSASIASTSHPLILCFLMFLVSSPPHVSFFEALEAALWNVHRTKTNNKHDKQRKAFWMAVSLGKHTSTRGWSDVAILREI